MSDNGVDFEFWNLYLRLAQYKCLSQREINCLVWRFGSKKTLREIAELIEGQVFKDYERGRYIQPKISKQGVDFILKRACRKIREVGKK